MPSTGRRAVRARAVAARSASAARARTTVSRSGVPAASAERGARRSDQLGKAPSGYEQARPAARREHDLEVEHAEAEGGQLGVGGDRVAGHARVAGEGRDLKGRAARERPLAQRRHRQHHCAGGAHPRMEALALQQLGGAVVVDPGGQREAVGRRLPRRAEPGGDRFRHRGSIQPRPEGLAREQRMARDRSCACLHDRASFHQMAPGSDHEIIDVNGREVRVSNPGKLYFPAVKLTKLDLVNYYVECEQAVVRGLRERPTVMKRCVDGVQGKPFFQKRVPDTAPAWLETVTVTLPSGLLARQPAPNDAAHLVWGVNLGVIDWNPWPVRRSDLDSPDELRVDLDPQPGLPFEEVPK